MYDDLVARGTLELGERALELGAGARREDGGAVDYAAREPGDLDREGGCGEGESEKECWDPLEASSQNCTSGAFSAPVAASKVGRTSALRM